MQKNQINIRLEYLNGDAFYITIPQESLQNTTACLLDDIHTNVRCERRLNEQGTDCVGLSGNW